MTFQYASGAYHLVSCLCAVGNSEEESKNNSFMEKGIVAKI